VSSPATPGLVESQPKSGYLFAALVLVICSIASVLLRTTLTLTDLAMIYLLGVIAVSIRTSRRTSVVNSFVSVTAFHFFCVPYYDSFVLTEAVYLGTLFAMLTVSLVISYLTSRIRLEAAAARDAEVRIQSERMRNALLSAISHDIKTPLASIYGAATSLVEQGDWLDAEDRGELAKNIVSEAERLNRVVSNLLEMTRFDAGVEIRKDWQSVEEIVGSAMGHSESLLPGRQIQITIPADMPLIRVDDVLIEQVLVNLLENIAKYTPPDSSIEIIGAFSQTSVVLSVRDHGPGLAPGDEERVFEKFFRGPAEGVRGVGLGLAICRAIIEAHGGTIRAGTNMYGGTTISIVLPIGGAQPQIVGAEDY